MNMSFRASFPLSHCVICICVVCVVGVLNASSGCSSVCLFVSARKSVEPLVFECPVARHPLSLDF